MAWLVVSGKVAAREVSTGKYFGWLEIDPATVGKPSKVRWRLAGEEKVESRAVLLTLTIVHLEKAKTVFSVERLPVEGEFAMSFPVYRWRGVPGYGHCLRHRRADDPNRAKHIRHRRGTAGASDDSCDRVFSRGDCVRFGSWKMEPPGGSIFQCGSWYAVARNV